MIPICIVLAVFVLLVLLLPAEPKRPIIHRCGLEMKARNGRLIHVRETGSEVEL